MIFQATSEFVIAFVRLILVKVGLTVDVRYEFGLKVVLKGLGCKQRLLQSILIEFLSSN